MKIEAHSLPGANSLYVDYLQHFDKLAAFYALPYQSEHPFREQIARLHKRNYSAKKLAPILERQNRHFGAGKATQSNIDLLAGGNAFAIVTGQQVGLFGGPMYVLYKALTAIKLADRICRQCRQNLVPVFWLAADDSDFAEVNHTTYLDKNFVNATLKIEQQAAGNVPMAEVQLGEQINQVLDEIDSGLIETEFKTDVLSALRDAYQPASSMSDAFGRWLMHCLNEFGLILVDPTDPEIKKLISTVYAGEIEHDSPSTKAVLQTSARLEAAGYSPQVSLREGRLNLFYLAGERKPLELQNGRIQTTDETHDFSRAELVELANKQPEHFSPNVILRPITQDVLFPTVAYVGGPAEIAYFAQLKQVYAHFDIPMPIIYPRKSVTLLEPAIDRILDKYDLALPDLWGNVETHITAFTRQHLPQELLDALAELKSAWPQRLLELRDLINQVDPTLEKMLENSAGRIDGTIDNLEKKIVQAGKRQHDIIRQQLQKASAALYPDNNLQERVHNFTPYLVKYGPALIERLYDVLDITSFSHQVVRL